MIWVAISNRGISKPLFRPSKSEAVDSDIKINEYLEKRLLPFILEHHPDSNYIFDHCHYSKQTVASIRDIYHIVYYLLSELMNLILTDIILTL